MKTISPQLSSWPEPHPEPLPPWRTPPSPRSSAWLGCWSSAWSWRWGGVGRWGGKGDVYIAILSSWSLTPSWILEHSPWLESYLNTHHVTPQSRSPRSLQDSQALQDPEVCSPSWSRFHSFAFIFTQTATILCLNPPTVKVKLVQASSELQGSSWGQNGELQERSNLCSLSSPSPFSSASFVLLPPLHSFSFDFPAKLSVPLNACKALSVGWEDAKRRACQRTPE